MPHNQALDIICGAAAKDWSSFLRSVKAIESKVSLQFLENSKLRKIEEYPRMFLDKRLLASYYREVTIIPSRLYIIYKLKCCY